MFELYQLEQLLAVSECGTLSQAAEQLHLSQSALSCSMQRLEAELQVTLFTRQKNRIELNECGRMAPQPDQHPGAGPGGEHHVLLCVPLRSSQGAERPVPGVVLSAQNQNRASTLNGQARLGYAVVSADGVSFLGPGTAKARRSARMRAAICARAGGELRNTSKPWKVPVTRSSWTLLPARASASA